MTTAEYVLAFVIWISIIYILVLHRIIKEKKVAFIVYQVCVVSKEVRGNHITQFLDTIVKYVKASTEEEAIGLFVKNTGDIKVEEKLNIKAFRIEW